MVYYIIILNRVIFTTVMEIVMVYGYGKGEHTFHFREIKSDILATWRNK